MNVWDTKYFRDLDGFAYRVQIVQDEDPMSPRDADNVTVMHTFDRNYYQPDDITRRGTHESIFPDEYQGPRWSIHHDSIDMRRARKYAALDPDILAVAAIGRCLNDELALEFDPDDEHYDGYVAVTRESWAKCMGDTEPTPELLRRVIEQDVEAFNRWARGEYVGFVVEQETHWQHMGLDGALGEEGRTMTTWEPYESIWGFDDSEYAMTEAKGTLPDGSEEIQEADLDVPPLPCGCVPHRTRMSGFGTAVWCETEQNAYCNFECPHEDDAQ